MSKCKVCNSALKNGINEQILAGVSYIDVAHWVKSQGQEISHMSIKRHFDSGHCGTAKRLTTDENLSDDEMLANEFVVPIPEIESNEHLQEFTRETMKRVYANQLAIVESKQRAYMTGKARYPQNEILGLRTIVACIASVSEGKDNVLKAKKLAIEDN